jgi:hypothetical protein
MNRLAQRRLSLGISPGLLTIPKNGRENGGACCFTVIFSRQIFLFAQALAALHRIISRLLPARPFLHPRRCAR